jgi:hypothetical protein
MGRHRITLRPPYGAGACFLGEHGAFETPIQRSRREASALPAIAEEVLLPGELLLELLEEQVDPLAYSAIGTLVFRFRSLSFSSCSGLLRGHGGSTQVTVRDRAKNPPGDPTLRRQRSLKYNSPQMGTLT